MTTNLQMLDRLKQLHQNAVQNGTNWAQKATLLQRELVAMKAKMKTWKGEAKNLRRRLEDYEKRIQKRDDAIRAYCDETDPDGEGATSRKLRRIVWNRSDTEALIAAEGYEK